MKRLWIILKNHSGSSVFLTAAVIFSLLIATSAGFEYLRLQVIAYGTRNAMESVVTQSCTANYDRLFNGLREGYSGAYQFTGSDWSENVDDQSIYGFVNDQLGTKYNGGEYTKSNSSGYEYKITDLRIKMTNTPFTSSGSDEQFTGIASYTVIIPMSFGWQQSPPLEIPIEVKAGYQPKF